MSFTGDRSAVLRAILEQPEEDTPRLAYADWLDEHGGETDRAHARFIRHQIAEAFHNKNVFYPAFKEVEREQRDVFGKGEDEPIVVDRATPAGRYYLDTVNQSRLMGTQTMLMLEKYAGAWLGDLPKLILPAVLKRAVPIIRRQYMRTWVDFGNKRGKRSSGPLFGFRRGFVWSVNFRWCYCPVRDEVLGELFQCWPVERVHTNREPAEFRVEYPFSVPTTWHWSEDGYQPGEPYPADGKVYPMAAIPNRVHAKLPHHEALQGRYPDELSAVMDFQYAAVALGRELAGLSMLPQPPMPCPQVKQVA